MSLVERIPGFSSLIDNIKIAVFGENNAHIDAVLDYFFSLRQQKREKIILYSCASLIAVFVLIIFLYFWGIHSLQNKINQATENVRTLNNIKTSYVSVNQEFAKLVDDLDRNNHYNTIVSVLVQKTKDLGIEISTISEKPPLTELQNNDPLFSKFQKVKIEYRLPGISLTKIVEYINQVQQMENRFQIKKIDIQQKFGTKLYFDVSLTLEAYVPSQNKQN